MRISRGLDRPGLLGFVTFILPIILDGLFQRLAPRLFEINTIALLQRDGISFAEVGAIKRRDRALQLAFIGAAATAVSSLASALLALSSSEPSWGSPAGALPAAAVGAGVSVALLASQVLRVWEPGMAPADVLAKTLQPVTDVISAEDRGAVVEGEDQGEEDGDGDGDGGRGGASGTKAVEGERKPLPFIGKGGLPLH